jgi:hypothetical protein
MLTYKPVRQPTGCGLEDVWFLLKVQLVRTKFDIYVLIELLDKYG